MRSASFPVRPVVPRGIAPGRLGAPPSSQRSIEEHSTPARGSVTLARPMHDCAPTMQERRRRVRAGGSQAAQEDIGSAVLPLLVPLSFWLRAHLTPGASCVLRRAAPVHIEARVCIDIADSWPLVVPSASLGRHDAQPPASVCRRRARSARVSGRRASCGHRRTAADQSRHTVRALGTRRP